MSEIDKWLLGLGISIVAGHFIISWTLELIRHRRSKILTEFKAAHKTTEKVDETPDQGLASDLLGMVDRALFMASLLSEHPQFIGIWLGLKFAGHWRQYKPNKISGWGRVNIFLIGNGLSLLFAFIGACILKPDIFFKIIGHATSQ